MIAVIQSALGDADLLMLQNDLTEMVGESNVNGVIVDVSALDVMDSFSTRTLRSIAYMIKLCGAEMVIVGVKPEIAFSMVQLGLTLEGVITALDLDEGLALLDREIGKRGENG